MVPDPGPGEALVAVRACGVCHTDLHYRAEGSTQRRLPVSASATKQPWHVVEAVGEGVTNVAPGDYVVLAWRALCGVCRSCRRGRPWYWLRRVPTPPSLIRDVAQSWMGHRYVRWRWGSGPSRRRRWRLRPSRQGGPCGPARGGRLHRLQDHGRFGAAVNTGGLGRGDTARGVRVRRSGQCRHRGGFPGGGSDDCGGGHRRPQAGVGPPFRCHTYGQRRRHPGRRRGGAGSDRRLRC